MSSWAKARSATARRVPPVPFARVRDRLRERRAEAQDLQVLAQLEISIGFF
jgi:hypothetical protein